MLTHETTRTAVPRERWMGHEGSMRSARHVSSEVHGVGATVSVRVEGDGVVLGTQRARWPVSSRRLPACLSIILGREMNVLFGVPRLPGQGGVLRMDIAADACSDGSE